MLEINGEPYYSKSEMIEMFIKMLDEAGGKGVYNTKPVPACDNVNKSDAWKCPIHGENFDPGCIQCRSNM